MAGRTPEQDFSTTDDSRMVTIPEAHQQFVEREFAQKRAERNTAAFVAVGATVLGVLALVGEAGYRLATGDWYHW